MKYQEGRQEEEGSGEGHCYDKKESREHPGGSGRDNREKGCTWRRG